MGRPKVKIIDDSQPTAEVKDQKSKIKKTDKTNEAKLESTNSPVIAIPTSSREKQSSSSVEDRHVANAPRDDKIKKQKPGKAKPRSKKYQEIAKDLDKNKTYPVNEAIGLVKKLSYSKFTGTLEAHINTVQTGIRGLVSLPFASGKKIRILAFGKGADASGADLVGSDDTVDGINKGKINFDLVVTTPEWMSKLAKVARILGPRGLMPNPKNGTISDDLKKTVAGFQSGKTEYKTEPKTPVIHIALGKLNQADEELTANIKTLIQTVGKTRIKKITLSPTMGPGIRLDLSSL